MDSKSDAPQKSSVGGELVLPAAAVVFTLYYFTTIWESPWTAQVAAFFVGAILLALIAIFAVVTLRRVARGECDFGVGPLIAPRRMIPTRIALLGLTAAYAVVLEWGGFTITTFAFLALAMLLLDRFRKKGLIVALAAAMALGGYLLFVVAFRTRFPEGPFEHALKGLF